MALKFACEKDTLAAAVAAASRVSAKSPHGAGLKIDVAQDGIATLTGTNMQMTIEVVVGVGDASPGAVVVPARIATDVVKALPSGRVLVEETEGSKSVKLSAGAATFDLRTLPPDEFPHFKAVEGPALSMRTEALAAALTRVLPAASSDDTRPILTAVSMASHPDGGLRLVATDSYRLAVAHLPGEPAPEGENLVPAALVAEAARHFDTATEVTVTLGELEIEFDLGAVVLRGRLIEGEFPKWERLVSDPVASVTVDKQDVLDVLHRLAIVANQGASTPVRFEPTTDEIILSAAVADIGAGVESVKATDFTGDLPATGFNVQYMVAGIEACPESTVRLGYTGDALKPVIIASPDDSTFFYLLMPVRTS